MKKLILIIVAVLGMGLVAQAQNANRSGAFIEFSGGVIMGDTPYTGAYDLNITPGKSELTLYKLQGPTISLAAGYRWAFASHWALEGKARAIFPFSYEYEDQIFDFLSISIIPGIRWTSKELASSNTSLYGSINAGVYIATHNVGDFCGVDSFFGGAYELQFGVNLSQKFYIGLIWNGILMIYEDPYSFSYELFNDVFRIDDFNQHNTLRAFGTLGINLGYRF